MVCTNLLDGYAKTVDEREVIVLILPERVMLALYGTTMRKCLEDSAWV